MHENHDKGMLLYQTSYSGLGVTWLWSQLSQHGPGWGAVPPLVMIGLSIWGAIRSARSGRADEGRKQRAEAREVELHAAKLALLKRGVPLPPEPEPVAA